METQEGAVSIVYWKGSGFSSYLVIEDVHMYCLLQGSREGVNLNTDSKITAPTSVLLTFFEYTDEDHFYLFAVISNLSFSIFSSALA